MDETHKLPKSEAPIDPNDAELKRLSESFGPHSGARRAEHITDPSLIGDKPFESPPIVTDQHHWNPKSGKLSPGLDDR